MPSVDELLNAAEVAETTLTETNDKIEIDADTRTMIIPDTERIFGVMSDEKGERKYFRCKRFVGNGIDLSKLSLRIIFQNASGLETGRDKYIVTDLATDGEDYVTFSWELSRKVTAYKGIISFIVCAIKTKSDGTITNEWNTTIANGFVLEGLEANGTQEQEEIARDYYNQLEAELLRVANEQKAELKNIVKNKVDKPSVNDNNKIPRAKDGEVEWVEVGQPTDEQTNNAVVGWLSEHPEATTTVQDGSIEEIKINKDFLPYIKNNYVTPEMFGAIGDGKTDDTQSFLKAIATGYPIVGFKDSKYVVKEQLEFKNYCNIRNVYLIAEESMNSVIKYNKRHTIIDNVSIDCNNLASYGILGSDSVPIDTLYVSNISNSSVTNALIDGFNTGKVRTYYNNCFAKLCKNAGFYIATSDTKHDCLVPIDCKYGVYVESGNTNIDRFHPWSWETKQTGLYIKSGKLVNIQYYYNDTNNIGIGYDGGVKLTIHTLANYNNQNAPSAVDEKSRMMVKVGEDVGSPLIVINNIIGSFRGCDDYFDYPTTSIRYIRVDNISFERNDVKFGRKFRSSYIDPYLYEIFLNNFSIISSVLDVKKVNIISLMSSLDGYRVDFDIKFEQAKLTVNNMTDILQIYYLGEETNSVRYKLCSSSGSFSGMSFHTAVKKDDSNNEKGCSVRSNTDFTFDGILLLRLDIKMELY